MSRHCRIPWPPWPRLRSAGTLLNPNSTTSCWACLRLLWALPGPSRTTMIAEDFARQPRRRIITKPGQPRNTRLREPLPVHPFLLHVHLLNMISEYREFSFHSKMMKKIKISIHQNHIEIEHYNLNLSIFSTCKTILN